MIGDERIERAALAVALTDCGQALFDGRCAENKVLCVCRYEARVALTADAPEIAAAEIRGQIAEAAKWRDHIAREQETARTLNPVMALAFGTIRCALDDRIAKLKANTEPTGCK